MRLYQDLNIYGDIAEAYMNVLADRYHVNMAGFEFDSFFPQEFAGKSALARSCIAMDHSICWYFSKAAW